MKNSDTCSCNVGNRRYCARLIYNMGGVTSALNGSELGTILLNRMLKYSIHDVRKLIDNLMDKEYDLREPIQMSEKEILLKREVCQNLIVHIHQTQETIQNTLHSIDEKVSVVMDAINFIQSTFVPCLSLVPFKGNKTGAELTSDFESLFFLLKDTRSELNESHFRGLDEMEGHNVAIDSDEEERLFEELDQLTEAQERMEAFKGNAHKFMANSVQKAFRVLEDLETSFRLASNSAKYRLFAEMYVTE